MSSFATWGMGKWEESFQCIWISKHNQVLRLPFLFQINSNSLQWFLKCTMFPFTQTRSAYSGNHWKALSCIIWGILKEMKQICFTICTLFLWGRISQNLIFFFIHFFFSVACTRGRLFSIICMIIALFCPKYGTHLKDLHSYIMGIVQSRQGGGSCGGNKSKHSAVNFKYYR